MSVAKPPPSILLPFQLCYRANFVTVPVIGREKELLQKSKRKKEEHATRKVEAQKKSS